MEPKQATAQGGSMCAGLGGGKAAAAEVLPRTRALFDDPGVHPLLDC